MMEISILGFIACVSGAFIVGSIGGIMTAALLHASKDSDIEE